jgi:hypothetical protein
VTLQLELSPESEARLAAEARAQGIPLEKVAERLLQEALAARPAPGGKLSVEAFHALLAALAKGSEELPNLETGSFTRESFYKDRG